MLGGTQSLHCNGRDEALALPTEESARIALRTQQIIAAETGVANTVDPVAGSYAIEALTNEIERGAEALLARIDARRRHAGGDRDRPDPARDPGVGLPRAAGDRRGRGGRRRRQPVRRPRRHGASRTRSPLFQPIDPGRSSGSRSSGCAPCARAAAPSAWRAALARSSQAAARRQQPGAADHRRRRSAGDRRRDRRRAARGVRRVSGDRTCEPACDAPRSSTRRPARVLSVALTTVFDSRRRRSRPSTMSASRSAPGETLGLVGESGSGKSVTALSIMRLVQPPGRIAGGAHPLQGPRPARRCRETRDARRSAAPRSR